MVSIKIFLGSASDAYTVVTHIFLVKDQDLEYRRSAENDRLIFCASMTTGHGRNFDKNLS
jgi:hypothetical protein